jgi:signal transduction histidine kinase
VNEIIDTQTYNLLAMSRWKLYRRDLGTQIFTLYLLLIIPAALIAFLYDSIANAQVQRDASEANISLAQTIGIETDATLQQTRYLLDSLAEQPDVQARALLANAALLGNTDLARIYSLNASGELVSLHERGQTQPLPHENFSFHQYVAAAQRVPNAIVADGRISGLDKQPVGIVARALRKQTGANGVVDEVFDGVIVAEIALDRLSATLSRIANSRSVQSRLSLVDGAGQIVSDSERGKLLAAAEADYPDVMALTTRNTGTLNSRDSSGRQWLRSYAVLPVANWRVIVQRPSDTVLRSASLFSTGVRLAMGVIALGSIAFWIMLSRRVIAPLERLADFSSTISQRSVTTTARTDLLLHAQRTDQMGELCAAMLQMERSIERRFAEQTTLLETSTAVVASLDVQHVLDTMLQQVRRLLKVERCAILELNEQAGELQLRAALGLSETYVRYLRTRDVSADYPSTRAIQNRSIVLVRDTETEAEWVPNSRQRALGEGYRTLLAVPLISPHAPPATLVVYWREPNACTPEDVNLIAAFANQAAMAIANASLFARTDERLREQTRTLEALVQSLNDGLILEGSNGQILYCNRRVMELTDITTDALRQHNPALLRQRLLARALAHQTDEKQGGQDEVTLQHRGRTLVLRLQSFNVTDDANHLIGRGELWLDISGDKELDRMKSTLIAMASHELRTPLASIKGNISSLLADDVKWDADAQREFLQAALKDTDRLSAFITDLLDLSKIQSGMFKVRREACSVLGLVQNVMAGAPGGLAGRTHMDLPPNLPLVSADPPRVEAVLRNLFENAQKYSPAHSPVRLRAEQHNGHVLLRVSSQGTPIALDQHERIFEPFYRVEHGVQTENALPLPSGAGIGLTICKGFVEAHGGKIWLEADAQGNTFAFTLPVMK